MNTDGWWRIEQKHACFALVVRSGVVQTAAPIAGWTKGKPWQVVRAYYAARGAKIARLPD